MEKLKRQAVHKKRLPLFCRIFPGKCKEKERKDLENYAIIRNVRMECSKDRLLQI